jgi:hypothetical protein
MTWRLALVLAIALAGPALAQLGFGVSPGDLMVRVPDAGSAPVVNNCSGALNLSNGCDTPMLGIR